MILMVAPEVKGVKVPNDKKLDLYNTSVSGTTAVPFSSTQKYEDEFASALSYAKSDPATKITPAPSITVLLSSVRLSFSEVNETRA
jgi:hypothetical protein